MQEKELYLTITLCSVRRFYMYYYPWSTFLAGCAIVSTIQVFAYTFIGFVSAYTSCSSFNAKQIIFFMVLYPHMCR